MPEPSKILSFEIHWFAQHSHCVAPLGKIQSSFSFSILRSAYGSKRFDFGWPGRLKMLVKLPKQRSNNSARRTNEHDDESVSDRWSWSDNCVTMASLVPPFKKGVPGCLSMLIGIIYSLTSVDTFQQPLGLMRSTMLTRDIQKYWMCCLTCSTWRNISLPLAQKLFSREKHMMNSGLR